MSVVGLRRLRGRWGVEVSTGWIRRAGSRGVGGAEVGRDVVVSSRGRVKAHWRLVVSRRARVLGIAALGHAAARSLAFVLRACVVGVSRWHAVR